MVKLQTPRPYRRTPLVRFYNFQRHIGKNKKNTGINIEEMEKGYIGKDVHLTQQQKLETPKRSATVTV